MKKIENREAGKLYEELMDRFRRFLGNPTYFYEKKQHHLYEESEHPGISRSYYNECGEVTLTNSSGDTIKFEISRYHGHQHNGCSGLCASPCRKVVVSRLVGDDFQEVWSLNVVCGTLYYKGEVTSLEFPYELLEEQKEEVKKEENKTVTDDTLSDKDTEVERTDYLGELTKVRGEYDSYLKQRDSFVSERDKKIEDTINSIRKSYSKRIEDCDNKANACSNKIKELENIINNYSKFDINMLGYALSHLISMIECSDYYYKKVPCKFVKRVHGVIDSWDEDSERTVHILTPNGDTTSIDEDELESSDIVLLDGSKTCSSRFSYIQEFIQYMINYRTDNGMDEFTQEDMVLLLQKFLDSYQDRILENYKAKIKVKIGNIKL